MNNSIISIALMQHYLFKQLQENTKLKGLAVYSQIPKNSSFPYAYIGEYKADIDEVYGFHLVSVDQKIMLYSRDDNLELINSANEIVASVEGRGMVINNIKFKYAKLIQMNFDVMRDGKTYEASLLFKIKIEVERNNEKSNAVSY